MTSIQLLTVSEIYRRLVSITEPFMDRGFDGSSGTLYEKKVKDVISYLTDSDDYMNIYHMCNIIAWAHFFAPDDEDDFLSLSPHIRSHLLRHTSSSFKPYEQVVESTEPVNKNEVFVWSFELFFLKNESSDFEVFSMDSNATTEFIFGFEGEPHYIIGFLENNI